MKSPKVDSHIYDEFRQIMISNENVSDDSFPEQLNDNWVELELFKWEKFYFLKQ